MRSWPGKASHCWRRGEFSSPQRGSAARGANPRPGWGARRAPRRRGISGVGRLRHGQRSSDAADDDLMPSSLRPRNYGGNLRSRGIERWRCMCIVPLLRASLLEFSPVDRSKGSGAEVATASFFAMPGFGCEICSSLRWGGGGCGHQPGANLAVTCCPYYAPLNGISWRRRSWDMARGPGFIEAATFMVMWMTSRLDLCSWLPLRDWVSLTQQVLHTMVLEEM